ncbi:MAG: sugar ABC transporter substrate-binding protein [Treponema sp.]|nr:sugar ABC transporter substrate-binding protein [Treponema sp.]
MKKVAVIGLILLVGFLFFACGGGGSSSKGDIEIVFAYWGSAGEAENTERILAKYSESHPGVTVKGMHINQEEYTEKIMSMAAGGNLPDAGMILEASIIGWARQGIMSTDDIYKDVNDRPLPYLAFKDGGNTVSWSAANEVLALWYNKALFDAAGVEYPPASLDKAWSWDEFVEVARRLTIDSNGRNATQAGFDRNNVEQYGCYINQIAWQMEVWALSNGGRFFSEDGRSIVFDDKAIEGMQKVFDLYVELGIGKPAPDQNDSGFAYGIGSGKVAMSTEGQWAVGNHELAGNHGDGDPWFPGLDYGVAVLPYMQNKVTISTAGAVATFAGSKNPAAVAEFVRWYTSPEENFGVIAAGWWMPNLQSWYTDAKLPEWVNNNPARAKIGAANYKSAIVDVALSSNAKSTCWYYTPNTDKIYAILGPALMEAITGAKTAKEVVEAVRAQMQSALNS